MLQPPLANSSSKSSRWLGFGLMASLVLAGASGYQVWKAQSVAPPEPPTVTTPQITTVTALGRLEPQGEVTQLSAPSNTSNRIEQLLVEAGEQVEKGQVIAILDNRDRLQAVYQQAQEDVKVAQAQLDLTQAGAKQGEINAQRAEIDRLAAQRQGDINAQTATVARLTSELRNAETEYQRYESLYQEGAISASDRDSKRLVLERAQNSLAEAQAILNRIKTTSPAQLNQAKANLERITEIRPEEVRASQAQVQRAIAAMQQAKADLDNAYVRSPVAGEILDIHTRAGEVVGTDGIVEIGQTQQMYAIAEVYQSDINDIKVGQTARVKSDSLAQELTGVVERIDSQVRRQTVVNTDPSANIDNRVIEVHILLDPDSSQQAAKFTNLQVTVVIEKS